MSRLTPAQRQVLEALAKPGAEARAGRFSGVWWTIWVGDKPIRKAHAESLMALRLADLVTWERDGAGRLEVRQRITSAGRARVAPSPAEQPGYDNRGASHE